MLKFIGARPELFLGIVDALRHLCSQLVGASPHTSGPDIKKTIDETRLLLIYVVPCFIQLSCCEKMRQALACLPKELQSYKLLGMYGNEVESTLINCGTGLTPSRCSLTDALL